MIATSRSRRTVGGTPVRASRQAAFGGCLTVIGVVLTVGLFGTLFYVQQNGRITLTTAQQVIAVVLVVCIVVALALLCSLLATIVNFSTLMQTFRASRAFALVCSALLLAVLLIFSVTTLIPRVLALGHVGTQVAPFAYALRDNCQEPLQQVTTDLTQTVNDDQATVGNDLQFAAKMQSDANRLQQDATLLTHGFQTLQSLSAPDAKYQQLLTDCQRTTSGVSSFLTDDNGPHAIQLPAPYNQLIAPKMSGIRLLKTVALLAAGNGPIQVPASALQPALAAAIPQILALVPPRLLSEGNQLVQDIRTTLDTSLAPFKETIPLN